MKKGKEEEEEEEEEARDEEAEDRRIYLQLSSGTVQKPARLIKPFIRSTYVFYTPNGLDRMYAHMHACVNQLTRVFGAKCLSGTICKLPVFLVLVKG